MRCAVLFLVLMSAVLLSIEAIPAPTPNHAGQVQLARRFFGDPPPDPEAGKNDPITWARIAFARFCAFLNYKLNRDGTVPPAVIGNPQPANQAANAPANQGGNPATGTFDISVIPKSGASTLPEKGATGATTQGAGGGGGAGTVPKKDAQAVPKDQLQGKPFEISMIPKSGASTAPPKDAKTVPGGGAESAPVNPSPAAVTIYAQAPPADKTPATITFSADEASTLDKEKAVAYPYFQDCVPAAKPVRCADANKLGIKCRTLADVVQGSKCVGPYVVVGYIASGSFGSVYLAHVGDKFFALKLERTDITDGREPFNPEEYNIPKALVTANVPGVIQVFDIFTPLKINGYSMEVANGGTLMDNLGKYTGVQMKAVMEKLAVALEAIHAKGVTIRDIKPDNILIVNGEPKYADFGLARDKDEPFGSNPGHCKYLSPEVLFTGRKVTNYRPVDVFALGCTFYDIFTGKFAAASGTLIGVHDGTLIANNPKLVEFKQKDKTFADLIVFMLNPDPTKRATANKVVAAIKAWTPK